MRILLGNTAVVEKHDPRAVGVNPESPDEGLAKLNERLPDGVEASLVENQPTSNRERGPAQLVVVQRPDLGNRVVEVGVPAFDWLPARAGQGSHEWRTFKTSEIVAMVSAAWPYHSDADGPEWVECADEGVCRAIADEYTHSGHTCEIGRPDGWEADSDADSPADLSDSRPPIPEELHKLLAEQLNEWDDRQSGLDESSEPQALMTNVGRDAAFVFLYDTTRGNILANGFNYMALTANNAAPAAGDTSLTGEIATAGGGLLRAQAAYAHTNGTSTGTLTKTFTANGSDSLPVTLAKIGLFSASSSGTMGHATLLNATATLNVSGDNVTVTETITITPS